MDREQLTLSKLNKKPSFLRRVGEQVKDIAKGLIESVEETAEGIIKVTRAHAQLALGMGALLMGNAGCKDDQPDSSDESSTGVLMTEGNEEDTKAESSGSEEGSSSSEDSESTTGEEESDSTTGEIDSTGTSTTAVSDTETSGVNTDTSTTDTPDTTTGNMEECPRGFINVGTPEDPECIPNPDALPAPTVFGGNFDTNENPFDMYGEKDPKAEYLFVGIHTMGKKDGFYEAISSDVLMPGITDWGGYDPAFSLPTYDGKYYDVCFSVVWKGDISSEETCVVGRGI